ncbi:MAG: hypothetical protein UR23_C0009G0005 [Candidatus Roizmanbacteria bacterium GW2011_GWA2_32_13]|uniref:Toxin-antitoxin system, toxin component, RelE family n=1 Tax=Candidatus Roizmanbacteria bacterium GW2011_GWA2_32_13 TaxID=1618475 RepID=A0A0G0BDL6_9BACT|nr:MAG: hypothetical protein UR23_C0009G0005 [Candidatus Roizmanbacteria bacterium GW2011_GWA2_32_13]
MKLIGKDVLYKFKSLYAEVRSQIDSWEAEAEAAQWKTPLDIKRRYATASFLKNNQVVFNIKGNKYRLLVKVNYENKIVLIIKAGTHKEYMRW